MIRLKLKTVLTKKTIFFFFLIFISLTFYRLPQAFFQQDEWATFGLMTIFEQDPIQAIRILLPGRLLDHFVPTTFFIDYLQYRFFGLQFSYYALFSLSLHLINSFLVYYLFKQLSQKQNLSLAAGLIFAVNSLGHQAITWVSTSTSTQGATLFGLISLILFLSYLNTGQKKIKLLSFSMISFLISLTFKENSIFIFTLLPLLWFLHTKSRFFSQFKKLSLAILLTFFVYLLLRGIIIIGLPPAENVAVTEKSTPPLPISLFYRLIIGPFRVMPQSILTTNFLLRRAQNLVFWSYPQFVAPDDAPDPYLVESFGFDLICVFLSGIILICSFLVLKYFQKKQEDKLIQLLIFSLSFVVVAALPFIFILGGAGFVSIFEPRNLYFINVGSSLFLALIILAISKWLVDLRVAKSFRPPAAIFLFLVVFLHISNIHQDLKALKKISQLRKGILTAIYSSYPRLPEKVVFYTESDSPYYGLPDEEKILPFQTGLGQTLLIWYQHHGKQVPLCMFTHQYEWLFQIEDQGYQYCQGRGFGYFRKMENLKSALEENQLSPDNVIAFRFNSETETLTDITHETRFQLATKGSNSN